MIAWTVCLLTNEPYIGQIPVVSKMYNKLSLGLLFPPFFVFKYMCVYEGCQSDQHIITEQKQNTLNPFHEVFNKTSDMISKIHLLNLLNIISETIVPSFFRKLWNE